MKKMAKKPAKKAPAKTKKKTSAKKTGKKAKNEKKSYENWHLPIRSEQEQMRDMNEDLRDAWVKLRGFANSLGEHKFHTSAKAMMFTRRLCFMFARPKKAWIEVTFFLPDEIRHPQIHSAERTSKTRAANIVRLVHSDQVIEPFTDWVRAAFDFGA